MVKNKIKYVIIILINIIGTITAEENIDFSFQFSNYGYGLNFGPDKNNIELSLELFNIFLDNQKTNIGLKISPINLYTDIEIIESMETKSITYLNFVNMNLYWNCFNEDRVVLGPFFSFEYFILRDWENIGFNDITISSGIKFIYKSDRVDFSIINYHSRDLFYAVEIETGYRYNSYDGYKFYFLIKTDLIYTLLFIANIGSFFSN